MRSLTTKVRKLLPWRIESVDEKQGLEVSLPSCSANPVQETLESETLVQQGKHVACWKRNEGSERFSAVSFLERNVGAEKIRMRNVRAASVLLEILVHESTQNKKGRGCVSHFGGEKGPTTPKMRYVRAFVPHIFFSRGFQPPGVSHFVGPEMKSVKQELLRVSFFCSVL